MTAPRKEPLQLVADALAAPELWPQPRILLVALAVRADERGVCCATCDELARATAQSARTVAECIGVLSAFGVVRRDPASGGYRVTLPARRPRYGPFRDPTEAESRIVERPQAIAATAEAPTPTPYP